jgi:hypothetical protein
MDEVAKGMGDDRPVVENYFNGFQHWSEGMGVDGVTDWRGEMEVTWAALWFSFSNLTEGGTRRCAGRRRTGRGGGGAERPRRKKGPRVGQWWTERSDRLGLAREFPRKYQVGLPRLLGRIEELNRKASIIIFEYIFKAFAFKFKDSNIFKPNLNWCQLGIN